MKDAFEMLILSMIYMVITLLLASFVSAQGLNDDVASYYKMDNSTTIINLTRDTVNSPNGNNGNLTNGVTSGVKGFVNQAYKYNVENTEFIEFGNVSDFNFGTNNFTLAALIHPDTITAGVGSYFMSKHEATFTDPAGWGALLIDDGSVAFIRETGSPGVIQRTVASSISTDEWSCVIISYNFGNEIDIYINGTEADYQNNYTSFATLNNDEDFKIGAQGGGVRSWNGSIDESIIYVDRFFTSIEAVELCDAWIAGQQFPNLGENNPPNITNFQFTNTPLFNGSPVNFTISFFDDDSTTVLVNYELLLDGVPTQEINKTFNASDDLLLFFEDFEDNTTSRWTTFGTVAQFAITDTENISGNLSAILNTGSFANTGGIFHNTTDLDLTSGVYRLNFLFKQRLLTPLNENNNIGLTNNTEINGFNFNGISLPDTQFVSTFSNNLLNATNFSYDGTDMLSVWNMTVNMNMDLGTFNVSWTNPTNDGNSSLRTWDDIDQLTFIKFVDVAGGDTMNAVIDNIALIQLGAGIVNVTDVNGFECNCTPGLNVTIIATLNDSDNITIAQIDTQVESNFSLNLSNITITPPNPDNQNIINSSSTLTSSDQDVDINVSWFINNESIKNTSFFFVLDGISVSDGINCITFSCSAGDNITVIYNAENGFLSAEVNITFNVSQFVPPPPVSLGNFTCISFSDQCIDGQFECLLAANNATGVPLSNENAQAFNLSCNSLFTDNGNIIFLLLVGGLVLIGFALFFKIPALGIVGGIMFSVLGITILLTNLSLGVLLGLFGLGISFIFVYFIGVS